MNINYFKEKSPPLQKILTIIMPDGMPHHSEILRLIVKNEFLIIHKKYTTVEQNLAYEFFKERSHSSDFLSNVLSLPSGPLLLMCLAKENAIKEFQMLVGPEKKMPSAAEKSHTFSFQAIFGDATTNVLSAIYVSKTLEEAAKDIQFFFPNLILLPIKQPFSIYDLYPGTPFIAILFDGLYKVSRVRPDKPIEWLAEWLLSSNYLGPIIRTIQPGSSKTKQKFLKSKIYSSGTMSSAISSPKFSVSNFRKPSRVSFESRCDQPLLPRYTDTIIKTNNGKKKPTLKSISCPLCGKTVKFIITLSDNEMALNSTISTCDCEE